MFPEDDRPNSYDVTIDHSAEASVDTPIPYGYSTNPPVNTPPAGSLGPGGFATAEDSQAISDLQGQVAMNGSAAASNNAARDAAFAELAEETESSDDPGDESTTEPPSASSVAATYVNGQGAIPMPGNPQVISSTAGAEAAAADSETRRPGVWGSIKNFLFGNGEPSAAATRAEAQRQRNREMQRSGAASLRADMGLVDQEAAQRSLDAIDTAATVAKEAGSMALDSAPVIGSMKSIEELRTGVDINGNEVSKTQAVLGMGLGLFGLKGAGKGIGKGLSQISDKADDIADTAKAASKASKGVSRHDGPRNFVKNNPEFEGTHEIHHSREWNVLKRYPDTFTPDELNLESMMRPILKGQTLHGESLHRSHIRKSWDAFQRQFKDRFDSGEISVETMRKLINRHADYIDRMYLGIN